MAAVTETQLGAQLLPLFGQVEPRHGLDIAQLFPANRLAAQGKAIILISSELPEVLGMSDRVVVMHEGRVSGEITDVAAATQEDVLALAMGLGAAHERSE